MKSLGRNDPCWCKSGTKYKKCHLNRDGQEKENPWAAVETNRKAFQQKKCCAREVGLGACDGRVIKAHTVSRGPNLSRIAKDGHVLQYGAQIADLNKNGGQLSIKRIGISDASSFSGFCSEHDRVLFSCIENEPFTGRPDQCLAAAYRTMSRELYGKDAVSHLRETLRGADKGMSTKDQFLFQALLEQLDFGNEAARKDLSATYAALTTALVRKDTSTIHSLVIKFGGQLPFMFAGAWSPFTDLFNNELQAGFADDLLEQVFFTSFAGATGDFICISWKAIDKAPGKVIADQIQALPCDQQADACLQLVVKHVENIFYNPDWFEGLSAEQRQLLDQLAMDGVDTFGSPPSSHLSQELRFGLPTAISSQIV